MYELIYTSTKAGLKPGASGFASVAWTWDITPNLITPLENLSGYQHLYLPGDPNYDRNPVCCSYIRLRHGSQTYCIASRIANAGLDYTGRTNKIAHHIVLDQNSEPENDVLSNELGPAGMFLAPDNFMESWDGPSRTLDEREDVNVPDPMEIQPGKFWEKWKGDAGWAGVVAKRFLEARFEEKKSEYTNLFLEITPEIPLPDLLMLIAEVCMLLPKDKRPFFTFNTYFVQQQIGADCFLRMTMPNNPAAASAKRLRPDQVLTLDKKEPIPENIASDPLVSSARLGLPWQEEILLPVDEQQTPPPETKNAGKTPIAPAVNRFGHVQMERKKSIRTTPSSVQQTNPGKQNLRLLIFSALFLLIFAVLGIIALLSGKNNAESKEQPPENQPVQEKQEQVGEAQTELSIEKIPADVQYGNQHDDTAAVKPPAKPEPKKVPKKEPVLNEISLQDDKVLGFICEIFSIVDKGLDRELNLPIPNVVRIELQQNGQIRKQMNPDSCTIDVIGTNGRTVFSMELKDGGTLLISRQSGEFDKIPSGLVLFLYSQKDSCKLPLSFREKYLPLLVRITVGPDYSIKQEKIPEIALLQSKLKWIKPSGSMNPAEISTAIKNWNKKLSDLAKKKKEVKDKKYADMERLEKTVEANPEKINGEFPLRDEISKYTPKKDEKKFKKDLTEFLNKLKVEFSFLKETIGLWGKKEAEVHKNALLFCAKRLNGWSKDAFKKENSECKDASSLYEKIKDFDTGNAGSAEKRMTEYKNLKKDVESKTKELETAKENLIKCLDLYQCTEFRKTVERDYLDGDEAIPYQEALRKILEDDLKKYRFYKMGKGAASK